MKKNIIKNNFDSIIFSEDMTLFLEKSVKYAILDKSENIELWHVLFAILNDDYNENIIIAVLDEMKVDINIFKESLLEKRKESFSTNKVKSDNLGFSEDVIKLIKDSFQKIKQTKEKYEPIDFFFALLKHKNSLSQILFDNAIDFLTFKSIFEEINEFVMFESEENEREYQPNEPIVSPPFTKSSPTESFLLNLNDEYKKGSLSKCIGREDEIQDIERVLNRKNKKNVLMIGKAGVGKTNIVEGLVERIINNKTSIYLKDKIILSLNLNSLLSGTIWRGQFEQKMENLIHFLKQNQEYILFIDEFHSALGAGNTNGGLDFINILKPALARGEIQVIAATTPEEKTYIERDRALMRRLHVQHIDVPSKEDTFMILEQIKSTYEKTHNVKYSKEIISLIVDLSEKYAINKNFPDKSIELMDDIGSYVKINKKNNPMVNLLNNQLTLLQNKKITLFQTKNYENAKNLLLEEQKILDELQFEINKEKNGVIIKITPQDVFTVAQNVYNVKNISLLKNDNIFQYFENNLKSILMKIQGQDEIVKEVFDILKTKKVFEELDGMSPTVFLFIGKTGVGKTYLCELLAEHIYNGKLKKINGENYQEKHSISNLKGSPKGYVDSDSGSDLYEYVKFNPECLICIDEIEKAHPDFYDAILTILDKGLITDKDGMIIDFRKTTIIMTSNIGMKKISEFRPIGFDSKKSQDISVITEKELKKKFAPEFLNRIDGIYHFNSIETDTDFTSLLNDKFNKIKKFLKNKKIEVNLSEQTKKDIIEECLKNGGGVRELQRQIDKKIKNKIITAKMRNKKMALVV